MKKLGLVALLAFSQLSFAECNIYFDSNMELEAEEVSSVKLDELGYIHLDLGLLQDAGYNSFTEAKEAGYVDFVVTTAESFGRVVVFGVDELNKKQTDVTIEHPATGFSSTEKFLYSKGKETVIHRDNKAVIRAMDHALSVKSYQEAKALYNTSLDQSLPFRNALDVYVLEKLPSCSTLYGN